MILKWAYPPRTVQLKDTSMIRRQKNPQKRTRHKKGDFLFSKSPNPSFLRVCKLTRKYMQDLGYEIAFDAEKTTNGPIVWFNFQYDILWMPVRASKGLFDIWNSSVDFLISSSLKKVETLLIESETDVQTFGEYFLFAGYHFEGLKKLLLVHNFSASADITKANMDEKHSFEG
jgi:hypothetical protein